MKSVATVNGAATADTIKSAIHNATNNGLRNRVDDCVYNVITSDAFPKIPPNTMIQYKATSMKRMQLDNTELFSSMCNIFSVELIDSDADDTNLSAVAINVCVEFIR